ncbi:hypothetical protein [uncultured Fusobacterium sp.]|uniref:hypothetical protein n=1 Tax=uncultured Fusobacterium sp. TaxID=159267 RepID=UPI0027DE87B1|nr:hypothetical protein [uncultured Fusobacterium sp.]
MKEIISEGVLDREQRDILPNMSLIGNRNITSDLEKEKTTKIFAKKSEEIKLLKKLNSKMKNNIQILKNLSSKTILSNEEEKELDKILDEFNIFDKEIADKFKIFKEGNASITEYNDTLEAKKKVLDEDNENLEILETAFNMKNENFAITEQSIEQYEKKELEIINKYNKEKLEKTKVYNKKMEELLDEKNTKEAKLTKKNYEMEMKKEEEIHRMKLRNFQKLNPKITENELFKIEWAEAEEVKEKNNNIFNQIQEKDKENLKIGIKNLSSMFKLVGDITEKDSIKNMSEKIGTLTPEKLEKFFGSKIAKKTLNVIKDIAPKKLVEIIENKPIPTFEKFQEGQKIGDTVSSFLDGGSEGKLGSMIGSGLGSIVGGAVGSKVGGVLGSIGGSLLGRKSKKKKKREERKRKAAQERLQRGLISGQYKWQDVIEAYNEDLLKLGTGSYIDLYDKVSANTDYDNVLSSLNGAKSGSDGVSMTTLKQLMPQYNEQQIIDWFKSLTGGAVLKGDILSTGEGKYGAIDIGELAKQVTNANRDLEKTLKTTIKGIINFSADSLAAVVKKGFFGGMEDLGNDIESMLAESLKNAFVNTEMSKGLFNGMSDKVSDVVKEMFVKDGNLGINLETGDLENLSLTQYMELIKKYTEISNEKLEELFRELGLNMDNLTGSMNNLNKNMSKNTVQGMATNLWRYNLGQNMTSEFNGVFEVEIPIILGDQLLDKRIIKITSDSIRKARRNKF